MDGWMDDELEEYSSMQEQWMRDTDVMIIVFSLVSKVGWEQVEGWRQKLVNLFLFLSLSLSLCNDM
jgi:hypothetical protein